MAKQSRSFGSERPFRAHLTMGHGMGKEVADLRADVEEGFQNNEAQASFPHLDVIDATSVVKAAGGDIVLAGRNLLQGQTFDALTLGVGTAQLDLALLKPGDSGWKVKIVQGTTLSALFQDRLTGTSVTMTNGQKAVVGVGTLFKSELRVGDKIKLDADSAWGTVASIQDDLNLQLAANYSDTGGTGNASKQTLDMLVIRLATAGSTSNQVATAINAAYVGIILATGHGAGNMLVAAVTKMTGGVGLYTGNKVWVAGVEALPKHLAGSWTNTGITVTMVANGALGTGDLVGVKVSSDGVCSECLTAAVAAP